MIMTNQIEPIKENMCHEKTLIFTEYNLVKYIEQLQI